MNYSAYCSCGAWQIKLSLPKETKELTPRICDCDFCQIHPSAIVSDPEMIICLFGNDPHIEKCGDELASFYFCSSCQDFLAVAGQLDDKLCGAVNSYLFVEQAFQKPIRIQPKLLSAKQKQERWAKLWGELIIQGVSLS